MAKESSIPHPSSRVWRWGWLPVALFLGAALCHDIQTPWTLEDNYNGAIYSQAAHNYLRAGVFATAGVPSVLYFGPLPIPPSGFYVHHPCLLPLTVAGIFSLFGEHEWAARLAPIAASLLTMLLLWLLVRNCAGARAATLSAGLFATLPMELHYGEMVNFEPLALLWMMASLLCLRYWRQTGNPAWRALMLIAIFLGLWTDWLGYFFAALVAVYFLTFGQKDQRGWAWFVVVMMAVSGALFLLQIHFVDPLAWYDAGTALLFRLSGRGASAGETFTLLQWLGTVGGYLWGLIPPFQWLLALAGVIYLFRRLRDQDDARFLARAAACLFLMDALYMAGFRNASYIHDFAGFYMTAPVAMMGGLALNAFVVWMGGMVREMALVRIGSFIVCAVVVLLAASGYSAALKFDSQFDILNGDKPEPPNLIPDLGREIDKAFPPDIEVLCNFDAYASPLPYYARRTIVNGLASYDDWKAAAASVQRCGGILWVGAPSSAEIMPHLSVKQMVTVDGVQFCIWNPEVLRNSFRFGH